MITGVTDLRVIGGGIKYFMKIVYFTESACDFYQLYIKLHYKYNCTNSRQYLALWASPSQI